MEGHRRYAHLNTTFPCENCGKHFKNKVARDRHQRLHVIWDAMPKRPSMEEIAAMEKIDLSKSDFRTCPFCQKEFKAKHTFKGHVKLCGKCCSLCHKRFEHPHIFRKHALKNHEVADWESLIYPPSRSDVSNEGVDKIELCDDKTSTSDTSVIDHPASNEKSAIVDVAFSHTAKICAVVDKSDSYDKHNTIVDKPIPFLPENEAKNIESLLNSNLRTCPYCQKEFKAKHTFKGHVKLCGKCCSICKKGFEHPHHFRSHALKMHQVGNWESLIHSPS